jgi:putative transposase
MGRWSKRRWGEKATGANPTDRGKSGTKRSVLTDGKGIPIAITIEGANRHDMKMTEATLAAQRIVPSDTEVRNLCLDKGYDYDEVRTIVNAWGYVGHIPPRYERDRIIHDIPNYRARRWVVERTHSWMNRFRRLLIRWEKHQDNYLGMIHLACACIVVRAIQVFG